MKQTGPINPKEAARAAVKCGMLYDPRLGGEPPPKAVETPAIHLPAEVGLTPLPRTSPRSRQKLPDPKNRKWITLGEAIKLGLI